MKNIFKVLTISLTIGLIAGMGVMSMAQPSAPPPPAGHGQNGNQTPGGAVPIGSGLVFLLSMGVAYGAKKAFNARKRLEE